MGAREVGVAVRQLPESPLYYGGRNVVETRVYYIQNVDFGDDIVRCGENGTRGSCVIYMKRIYIYR